MTPDPSSPTENMDAYKLTMQQQNADQQTTIAELSQANRATNVELWWMIRTRETACARKGW